MTIEESVSIVETVTAEEQHNNVNDNDNDKVKVVRINVNVNVDYTPATPPNDNHNKRLLQLLGPRDAISKAWNVRAQQARTSASGESTSTLTSTLTSVTPTTTRQDNRQQQQQTQQHPLCRAWQQLSDSLFGNNKMRQFSATITTTTLAGSKADADANHVSAGASRHGYAMDVEPLGVNQPPPPSSGGSQSQQSQSQSQQSGHVRLAARLAERQRTAAVAAQVELLQEQFSYLAASSAATTNTANTAAGQEEDRHALESPFKVDQVLPVEGQGVAVGRIAVAEKNTNVNHATVVTIAPSGFDLEATLAQITTTHHHTRAFLLLDLAHTVSAHRQFISLTAPPTGVYARHLALEEMRRRATALLVQAFTKSTANASNSMSTSTQQHCCVLLEPQFGVSHNRDLELLRLLIRLQVGLRCRCVDDVLAVREAYRLEQESQQSQPQPQQQHEENDPTTEAHTQKSRSQRQHQPHQLHRTLLLVDDPARTRQPNGYLRTLLDGGLAAAAGTGVGVGGTPSISESAHEHIQVAVDGPAEIDRIVSLLHRFRARRKRQQGKKRQQPQQRDHDPQQRRDDRSHPHSHSAQPVMCLHVTLRLPPLPSAILTERSTSTCTSTAARTLGDVWTDLLQTCVSACQKHDHSRSDGDGDDGKCQSEGESKCHMIVMMSGVSLDLAPLSSSSSSSSSSSGSSSSSPSVALWEEQFTVIALALRQVRVCLCHATFRSGSRSKSVSKLADSNQQSSSSSCRVDLTGLPVPFRPDRALILTRTLAKHTARPLTPHELGIIADGGGGRMDMDTDMPVVTFTADISHHLVAHAGALCCKIIGVKKQHKEHKNNSNSNNAAIHYYIDDGCYGSLSCNSASSSTTTCGSVVPKPLHGSRRRRTATRTCTASASDEEAKNSHNNNTLSPSPDDVKVELEVASSKYCTCTVWGPTCDGLDKVCDSVELPSDLKPNEDWLVFPQMGCGGGASSTAFNGFEAPNTAYCFLGYFAGSHNAFGGGGGGDDGGGEHNVV
jgi:hypothetical protein